LEKINMPEDFKSCIKFHGHLCPGLAIGYRAAKLGLRKMGVKRAADEELIAIVENDSCAVDAIQFLCSCTFGKGNLYFKDYGKMVFTFADRVSGKSIRLYFQGIKLENNDNIQESERRNVMIKAIMEGKDEDIFTITPLEEFQMPPKAVIYESIRCDICGETAISSRIINTKGQKICKNCFQKYFE